MFIVSLTYRVPIEVVEEHLEDHIVWLKEGYANGTFIASGRKLPRTGGVILAAGNREDVEALCAKDPFILNNVAEAEITEVAFTMAADGFEGLKGE